MWKKTLSAVCALLFAGAVYAACTPTPKPHPTAEPFGYEPGSSPLFIGIPDTVVYDAGAEEEEGDTTGTDGDDEDAGTTDGEDSCNYIPALDICVP